MLKVVGIHNDMIEVINTEMGPSYKLPVHFFNYTQEIKVGDIIKIVKDEVEKKKEEKRHRKIKVHLTQASIDKLRNT